MARERGLTVDVDGFNKLMDEQRARARAAQKKEIVAASTVDTSRPTRFVGFDELQTPASVLEVVNVKDKLALTLDISPMYAEMGGQVGDSGEAEAGGKVWHIVNTQKVGNTFLHFLADKDAPEPGAIVELRVNAPRRAAIQRHHSVTHLLHWALHEVSSPDATQKGSYVGPEKLTFDFSSAPLTPAQVGDVEKLVNERILENAGITWSEFPYAQVKGRKDIMQFFGEKYGDVVRVVQIGGKPGALDGYSMELCGGTHTRATGEIGLFRIVSESAVSAGIRRIEAIAGLRAYDKTREDSALISTVAGKINAPVADIEKKIDSPSCTTKGFGKAAPSRAAKASRRDSPQVGNQSQHHRRRPLHHRKPRRRRRRFPASRRRCLERPIQRRHRSSRDSQRRGVIGSSGVARVHRQIPSRKNHASDRPDPRRQRRRPPRQRPRRRQGCFQNRRGLAKGQGIAGHIVELGRIGRGMLGRGRRKNGQGNSCQRNVKMFLSIIPLTTIPLTVLFP